MLRRHETRATRDRNTTAYEYHYNAMNLIIMELYRPFFVRTDLGNRAEGSQQTRSECRSAIRRVSSAGFFLRKLAK